MNAFKEELITLINKHSRENGSDTPDFLLGEYLIGCLNNFDTIVAKRDQWYFDDSDKPLTDVITQEEAEKIANDINFHNDCAKATLGEVKKVTKEDVLPKERKKTPPVDDTLSDELIKYKIMLIYDYIDRKFNNDKSYMNTPETQKWVKEKFTDVLNVFGLSQYIRSILCDDRNNTPEVIDHNELVVDICYSMYIGPDEFQILHLTFPDKSRL